MSINYIKLVLLGSVIGNLINAYFSVGITGYYVALISFGFYGIIRAIEINPLKTNPLEAHSGVLKDTGDS